MWHPKIRRALDLVAATASAIDQNVYLFPWAKSGDVATRIASHKNAFFTDQSKLDELRRRIKGAYRKLFARLRDATPDACARALHTYAAVGSLLLVRFLQRFEGRLFTDTGRLVLRLYPDLPNLCDMRGPLVGLPYRHPVNALAYGPVGDSGFLYGRISRGRESDYEYLHLPRFDAEAFQDAHPGPPHVYYGWVVPQWLIYCDDPPPATHRWWITVVSDERGKERYTKHHASPWADQWLELEPAYDWPATFYERMEIEPGMPCWVWVPN